jgi:hypothetical protein
LKSRPAVVDKNPMEKPKCDQGIIRKKTDGNSKDVSPPTKFLHPETVVICQLSVYKDAVNGENHEFIAVFAGNTEAEAKRFLKQVKAKKEFSDAIIERCSCVRLRRLIYYRLNKMAQKIRHKQFECR